MIETDNVRKSGWLMLALLFLGTALLNYSNIIFAVRAADIMLSYNCSSVQIAVITTVSALPGAFLSIFYGKLLDRRGSGRVMPLCLLIAAAAFFTRTAARSYEGLLVLTFLAGVFLVPTGVVPAKALSRAFSEKQIPLAMGIYSASAGFGCALGFATCGLFSELKGLMLAVAAAAALLAALWRFVDTDTEGSPEISADGSNEGAGRLLQSRSLRCIMVCSFISCGVLVTLNTFLSRALCAVAGDAADTAVSVIGTVMNISLIIGGIITGALIARLQLFRLPFLVMSLAGGVLLLLAWYLPFGAASYVLFPLSAFLLAGAVGLNMARVPLLVGLGDFTPDRLASANGLCNTMNCLGGFTVPVVIAEITGESYSLVFIISFALLLVSGMVGLLVPEPGSENT